MSQFPDALEPVQPEFTEPPKWPKVIGIISVVWGVVNIGCLGCGLFGMFTPVIFGKAMAEQFPDGMPPQMTQGPSVSMLALFISGFALVALLIAAGATLLMRKYVSRHLHLVWVALAVLSAFWSAYLNIGQSQQTKQWLRDNPNTKFAQAQAQSASFAGIAEIAGWGIGLAIGLGYPIFCGVWFGMVKKNPEEYTRGVEQLM